MKKLNARFPISNRGFTSTMAIMVGTTMLLTFGAVYQRIKVTTHQNLTVREKEKGLQIADQGMIATITQLQVNPILDVYNQAVTGGTAPQPSGFYMIHDPNTPEEIRDSNNDLIGQYYSMAKTENFSIFGNEVYHVVTEGWPIFTDGHGATTRGPSAWVHNIVEFATVGSYFAAIKGTLHIGNEGSPDLRNAKIYGRSINFNFVNTNEVLQIGRVEYEVNYLPNPLAPDLSPKILIGYPGSQGNPDDILNFTNIPVARPSSLVFPSINTDLDYYRDLISPYSPVICDFQNKDGVNEPVLLPPAIESGAGLPAPGTAHDGSPTSLNHGQGKYHYYYCPGDIIIGNTKVQGQVVLATPGKVVVQGDVMVENTDTCESHGQPNSPCSAPLSPPVPDGDSKAHQLILVSKLGVQIHYDSCTNSDLDGDSDKLTLQFLAISPNATIDYHPDTFDTALPNPINVNCPNFDDYSLDFEGALYLQTTPAFKSIFPLSRTYKYMETLLSDPPPIRLTATILRSFEQLGSSFEFHGL